MQTSNKSRLQLANVVINLSLIPSTDVIQLPSSLKMAGCRNVSHCQQQFYSGLRSPGRSYLAFSRRSDGVECDKSCASSPEGTRGKKKKKKKKKNQGRPCPSNFSPTPNHQNAWNKQDHAQPTYCQLCLLWVPPCLVLFHASSWSYQILMTLFHT